MAMPGRQTPLPLVEWMWRELTLTQVLFRGATISSRSLIDNVRLAPTCANGCSFTPGMWAASSNESAFDDSLSRPFRPRTPPPSSRRRGKIDLVSHVEMGRIVRRGVCLAIPRGNRESGTVGSCHIPGRVAIFVGILSFYSV